MPATPICSPVLATMTTAPARILGLDGGRLVKGGAADIVIFDPDAPFVLDAVTLHSRAHNTPFDGRRFQGRVHLTYVGGEKVFDRDA